MDQTKVKNITFNININKFINKFYKNLLIRGIIIFVLFALVIVLIVSTVEYIAWFNNSGRLFLFLTSILTILFIFYYFFLIPLFRFLGLFKRISNKKTAQILTNHIPELKDYVFNVLELQTINKTIENYDLVNASLLQKIDVISNYNFVLLVKFKIPFSFVKYSLSVFILYLIMLFFSPQVLFQGTDRIIHFNNNYVKNLGFTINIEKNQLTIEKGNDIIVGVGVHGENYPSNLSFFIGNSEFLMEQVAVDSFVLLIKSVNNEFSFRVGNDEFKSNLYKVNVLNPPFLNSFKIVANYPNYTLKQQETFYRISNLKVPVGTKLLYLFECNYVDSLYFVGDSISNNFTLTNKLFEYQIDIFSSFNYSIFGMNNDIKRELLPNSFIHSISDAYPEIFVVTKINSANRKLYYFKGSISDDYGFSNLFFVCNNIKIPIPINFNLTTTNFFFSYEFDNSPKSKFYFEVYDNDLINGFKSSKTNIFEFVSPDYQDLLEKKNIQNKEIVEKMEKSLLLAQEFKKDIQEIKKNLISENLSSYEKQQFLNELENKQKTLEDLLNDLAVQNKNKNNNFNSFNQPNQELLSKQHEIQKLLEVVMDDELKKLFEELQKLSDDNKNLNNELDKLEMNYDNLSDQLDKNLELLRKFEIERDLQNISDLIDTISVDQKTLSNDSLSIYSNNSILNDNLNSINNFKKEFENILDKNSELNNPFNLEDISDKFDELSNDIENSMSDSQNDKEDKNDSKKSEKQKFSENSDKAKKLSEQIDMMINNNRVADNAENAETLRQVLENLFYFSFTQEYIYQEIKKNSRNSPSFSSNIRNQNNLALNFTIIKDSLYQLSKRTPYLGNHISKKVFSIENSLFDINYFIKQEKFSKLYIEQRLTIQYSNDLILLLSESLKNMESNGGGGGSSKSKSKKKKPKKGEPSLSDMRKSQESMKSQLESMIEQMKGGKGKSGKQGSEKIGKMLAQQEIFQNSLNKLKNSNGVGSELTKQLDEINKLIEKNRRDLINQNINSQSLIRQQQIVTRLLEAENAKMERELDYKRESSESIINIISNPEQFFINDSLDINIDDILNSNSINLNIYFKHKYQDYIKKLN